MAAIPNAIAEADPTDAPPRASRRAGWLRGLSDRSERAVARRSALAALGVRIGSAGIAYASHILLARWLGGTEFGIFVTVWTCVLLVGGLADLGLATSAQRFIPAMRHAGHDDSLRGFLRGSRLLTFAVATAMALAGAGGVWLARAHLDHHLVLPLVLAATCVPMYALGAVQGGIARAYDWTNLALLPPYILRPLLLLVLMAGAYAAGFAPDAALAVTAAIAATWLTTGAQILCLNRRLRSAVPAGPRRSETGAWLRVSMPIFVSGGLYFLLSAVDVLLLQHFRPPQEVAVYYAAAKTVGLAAFVSFAVATATAHRFAAAHAAGDRARLSALVGDAVRWSFWPSLAVTAAILVCGWPLLWMFGPSFTAGYPLMAILAVGIMARAAVGPVERVLNMLDQQRACTAIYAAALAVQVAAGLVLIPRHGATGAAIATSAALVAESILMFAVTRRRLDLHLFIWRRP